MHLVPATRSARAMRCGGSLALAAVAAGCHSATVAPPAQAPAPVMAPQRATAERLTDQQWIDSVAGEANWFAAARTSAREAAPSKNTAQTVAKRQPAPATIESESNAEAAAPVAGPAPSSQVDGSPTTPSTRTVVAGIGVFALAALLALTRRT